MCDDIKTVDQVDTTDPLHVCHCDGREHRHIHHLSRLHPHKRENITVNVNVGPVGCCDPSYAGSGGSATTQVGRPVHTTGTSDDSVTGGVGAAQGIIKIPGRPQTVWPGPRTKLYLPFLFIRAAGGDTGARPIKDIFWESPDILILPGISPSAAPGVPPDLDSIAKAGKDNTIYAHVWNLGQAPAWGALVEFYWFNPTLGFSGSDANLIGKTYVDLGGRGGTGSHKLVKCPFSWAATFQNGGHECLVVRISQPVTDPLSNPPRDASQNRLIGQRNIHVMTAAEASEKPTLGVNVGPLYGQVASVSVARARTETMPWLHLVTNSRTTLPATGVATGVVGITAATDSTAGLPNLGAVSNPAAVGLIGSSTGVTGDGKQVGFVATDDNPGNGHAHVYRVRGSQGGATFGGYTVVVMGS